MSNATPTTTLDPVEVAKARANELRDEFNAMKKLEETTNKQMRERVIAAEKAWKAACAEVTVVAKRMTDLASV